jgi:hypothetical protein
VLLMERDGDGWLDGPASGEDMPRK